MTDPSERDLNRRYVYGINPVLEALRARPEQIEKLFLAEGRISSTVVAEILSRARSGGIRFQKLPREKLSELAGGGVHQGLVAQVRSYTYLELEDLLNTARASNAPLFVALDGVEDPHNFGAIIRSAHAMGADGIVVAKDRAAPITGAVAKASAGAVEHCPIARVVNLSRALEILKDAGLWIAAADPKSEQTLSEAKLDGPLVAVIGGEGVGIRPGVLGHCDFRVRIPMHGKVASLNASVSAGILLYEIARQRATKAQRSSEEIGKP